MSNAGQALVRLGGLRRRLSQKGGRAPRKHQGAPDSVLLAAAIAVSEEKADARAVATGASQLPRS